MRALAVASTYRERGQLDDYLLWLEKTAQHESDGCSALLDLGDALIGAGRYGDAASGFGRALAKVPDHLWALPSLLYAKARLCDAESFSSRAKLLGYARDNPDKEHAQRLGGMVQPWMHHLPSPADASTDGLRRMVEKNSSWGKMSLRLSALEAPSCYLAFRLEAERQGKEMDLTVAVDAIQQPDPRQGRAEKPFELWSYRSLIGLKTDAEVLVPPPDPNIHASIAAIAQQPYQLSR